MAKDKLTDYDSTAANNTDIGGISIDEGMLPSNVNNALREVMSHLKDFAAGTEAVNAVAVDNLKLDGNTLSSTDTNGDITLDPNGTGDVIVASGNCGIGTSSPSSILHLSASNDPVITLTDTGFGASADITGSNGNLRLNSQTATIFDMADSEIARFDTSGNLLVGMSSSSGTADGLRVIPNDFMGFTTNATDADDRLVLLNRQASDGKFIEFRKANAFAGSIYTNAADGGSSAELCISSGNTGLKFDDTNNYIRPTNSAGAHRDDTVSLGTDNSRFKDLYLGGVLYMNVDSGAGSPDIKLQRTDTSVGSGNQIGSLQFLAGEDGSEEKVAAVRAVADDAYSSSSSATRLVFETTTSGSTSATERLRIQSSGITQIESKIMMGILGSSYESGERDIFEGFAGGATHFSKMSARNVADTSDVFKIRVGGNDKIKFLANGDGYWDGAADNGAADYAEYFEWDDGNTSNEDRVGYPVILTNGNKIRKATSDDAASDIIGIVSGRPAFVGDSASLGWAGKWQTDDYARRLQSDVVYHEWTDSDGKQYAYRADELPDDVTVPSDATTTTRQEDTLSDSYDSSLTYIPRSERQEWNAVGIMGKLRMRAGQPTGDRWIKLRDIATDDDGNVIVEEWLVR